MLKSQKHSHTGTLKTGNWKQQTANRQVKQQQQVVLPCACTGLRCFNQQITQSKKRQQRRPEIKTI